MHEYALVQALLQRVEAEAQSRGATAAHRIVVRIGPLAGVEPTLFASAYELCRSDTICRDAELVIADEDVTWRCTGCGAPIAAGRVLSCPTCGWPAGLAGGDALVLERIELEVPDHV
jgi:hydrogenase nickel incorporation protein HypA/HybF